MTVKELAAREHVSTDTIYSMIERGKVTYSAPHQVNVAEYEAYRDAVDAKRYFYNTVCTVLGICGCTVDHYLKRGMPLSSVTDAISWVYKQGPKHSWSKIFNKAKEYLERRNLI